MFLRLSKIMDMIRLNTRFLFLLNLDDLSLPGKLFCPGELTQMQVKMYGINMLLR